MIPIEAVDTNNNAQTVTRTVTPTGSSAASHILFINPAAGESSSSATGRVTVANSGVTGPITIKVADSVTNYNFNPKSVDVPVEVAPAAIDVFLGAPSFVAEGGVAMIRVQTFALTLPTVDLTYGVSVADLTGRTDSNGIVLDYVDEETYYVVLKAGQREALFEVQTNSIPSDPDGLDGIMEVTLESGVGYTPTGAGGTAYVEIRNGDASPDVLSVAGTTDFVVEGNNAIFNISRQGTVGNIDFEYKVSGPASIYSGTADAQSGRILDGSSVAQVMVPIVLNSALLTGTPQIRVTLQNSRQFLAAKYRIGTLSDTIDVIDDAPVVSVKNYPSNVTLGHPFMFTIETDSTLSNPVNGNIRILCLTNGTICYCR